MKTILVLILLSFVVNQEIDKTYSYQDFFRQFRDSKSETIQEKRQQIFNQKYQELLKIQSQGHELQITKFLDWTDQELQGFFNYSPNNMANFASSSPPLSSGLSLSPTSFDWRSLNRVTSVKDQGNCGSCWAFSATAQIQSVYAIATGGTKNDFSQQYVLQCSGPYSQKCNGGYPLEGLQLFNRTGIPFENTYPYLSSAGFITTAGICAAPSNLLVKFPKNITNVVHYSSLSDQQIQQSLYDNGPLSIALWANNLNFMGSKGAIQCPGFGEYDHAVLLVGYNTTHWFIKNSWGTSWGDGGYGYISKTPNKNCGIGGWIDVIVANNENINPTPPPTDQITVSVAMTDSYGDGWNGNIIGFMQNDVLIASFGQNFVNGKAPLQNPINITIPKNLQTKIVVSRLSSYTNQVGFVVKHINGTIIHQRISGKTYTSQTVFANFCPGLPCVVNPTVTLYLTMGDLGSNGWENTWLAFRQNGTLQPFTLYSGSTNTIPMQFKFNRNYQVDIIVYQVGSQTTSQIAYTLRSLFGPVIASRAPGVSFSANQILGNFTPNNINLNFVPILTQFTQSEKSREEKDQEIGKGLEQSLNGYKIGIYVLAPLLVFFIITSILGLKKSLDYKRKLLISQNIPKITSQNGESMKNLGNGENIIVQV